MGLGGRGGRDRGLTSVTFSVSVLCGGGDGGGGGQVSWEDNPGCVPLTAGGWPFVYLQSVPTIVFSCPDVCTQHLFNPCSLSTCRVPPALPHSREPVFKQQAKCLAPWSLHSAGGDRFQKNKEEMNLDELEDGNTTEM